MIAHAKSSRFFDASAQSGGDFPNSPRVRHSPSIGCPFAQKPRRVLIVDAHDEVYASLKRVLEDEGVYVERAAEATEVRSRAAGNSNDIVLINEDMPDECGWLISSKLRMSGVKRRVWLYTAQPMYCLEEWKKFAGVDHVFSYGRDLVELIRQVRVRVGTLREPERSHSPAKENTCRSLIPGTVLYPDRSYCDDSR